MSITKYMNGTTITAILDHYDQSALHAGSDYSEYEVKADALLQANPSLLESIDELNYADVEVSADYLERIKNLDESKLLDFELGLNNFLVVLKNKKANYEPFFLKFNGLMRQACPPLEVYNYVGHTATDIKPSDKSYSLLF